MLQKYIFFFKPPKKIKPTGFLIFFYIKNAKKTFLYFSLQNIPNYCRKFSNFIEINFFIGRSINYE